MDAGSMDEPRFVIEFPDVGGLEAEWQRHLARGGAFVPGVALAREARCTLVLVRPGDGDRMTLAAHVVWAGDGHGVGLELDDFGASLRDRIRGWIDETPPDTVPDLGDRLLRGRL